MATLPCTQSTFSYACRGSMPMPLSQFSSQSSFEVKTLTDQPLMSVWLPHTQKKHWKPRHRWISVACAGTLRHAFAGLCMFGCVTCCEKTCGWEFWACLLFPFQEMHIRRLTMACMKGRGHFLVVCQGDGMGRTRHILCPLEIGE